MFNTQEKRERSLGTKLFLKPVRCSSPKCACVRRPQRPGAHGKDRRRPPSEFGQLLAEKQKFKFTYGLRDAQLRRVFVAAAKNPGVTGEMFVNLLERRLDNVVYRLGLAASRSIARQIVSHGHLTVNGRKVTIPSYSVRAGDVIAVRAKSREHPIFSDIAERLANSEPPSWLAFNTAKLEGTVISAPRDFDVPFDVNRVVDYYSRIVK